MNRHLPALLVVALTSAAVFADEVHLTDGSKLVGDIQRMTDTRLTIQTSFAGTLTVPVDQVTRLSTDEKVTVGLTTGDRVVGRLAVRGDDQIITDTTFGDVTVNEQAQISGVWAAGQPAPEVVAERAELQAELAEAEAMREAEVEAVRAETAERVAELEAERATFLDPWSGRFEFGLNGDTGNEERISFNGRASAKREVENERLFFDLQGQYTRENGERSENEVIGSVLLERDISERFFVFGKGSAEFDEFENLDLRTTLTAGLGYFFIKKQEHEFKGRVGAGFQHESFDDGSNDTEAVVEIGYDYRIDLDDWLRFTNSLTYYPILDDPASNYRLVMETAGEVPLSEDETWKLRAGMRNEYDAMPQPGVDRLDTAYFMNLVYDWD